MKRSYNVCMLKQATNQPLSFDPNANPSTCRDINRVLRSLGFKDITAAQGRGYVYFYGPAVENCFSASVYVDRPNCSTYQEWIDEANSLIEESKNRY